MGKPCLPSGRQLPHSRARSLVTVASSRHTVMKAAEQRVYAELSGEYELLCKTH